MKHLQNEIIEMEGGLVVARHEGESGGNGEEAKKDIVQDLYGDGISLHLPCITVRTEAVIMYSVL